MCGKIVLKAGLVRTEEGYVKENEDLKWRCSRQFMTRDFLQPHVEHEAGILQEVDVSQGSYERG